MRLGDLDALKDHISELMLVYSGTELNNAILNAIDNAPTVEPERPQGEWISVSERLPERYEEVIITDIEVGNTYQSRYIGNGYWECDNGTFKNRVTAWQPFPRPYKKETNDEQ